MNYAILKTGSKQYRVAPGDVIDVEKLPAEEGSSLELTDVLAISRDGEVTIGNPLVPTASVLANVREQAKDKKIIVFKYKRKVRYRRKKGHRQSYTRLFISAIMLGDEEIGTAQLPEPPVAYQKQTAVEEAPEELQELDVVDPTAEVTDETEEEQPVAPAADREEGPVVEPLGELEQPPTDVPEPEPTDAAVETVVDATEAKPRPKARRKPRATPKKKPKAEVKEDGP